MQSQIDNIKEKIWVADMIDPYNNDMNDHHICNIDIVD